MFQFELTEEEKIINKFKISPIPTEEQIKEIVELQNTYTFYYKLKSETFSIFWAEGEVDFPNKLISAVMDILVRPVEVPKDQEIPDQMTCRLKDKPTAKDIAYFTDEILLTPKLAGKVEPIIDLFFSDKFIYVVEDNKLKVSYEDGCDHALLKDLLEVTEDERILLFTVENIIEADANELIDDMKDEFGGFVTVIYQQKYLEGNLHLLVKNEPRVLKVLKSHVRKIKRNNELYKRIFEKYEKEVRQRFSRHCSGWFENHGAELGVLFDQFYNEMRKIRDLK